MTDIRKISSLPPKGADKKDLKKDFENMVERITELQNILYAQQKHSLLVVLQGMDSSGKDGISRKVFGPIPAYAINLTSFKKPTEEEFAHDFLWRVHKEMPAKGMIKIFNRSHYEDILIQRVHKWIDKDRVDARIDAINAMEKLVQVDNNTTILKFYLHLSFERQGEKLQERLDNPDKNWKHNDGDWEERKHWDKYMDCYNDVFKRCDQPKWHIIPSDEQWYRNYCVAKIVLDTLEKMDLKFPKLESEMFA